MSTRVTIITLSILLLASLTYSVYVSSKLSAVHQQVEEWKDKYEEALIDVEEAYKRLEDKDQQVQRAFEEAEKQRRVAEEALAELQRQRARK